MRGGLGWLTAAQQEGTEPWTLTIQRNYCKVLSNPTPRRPHHPLSPCPRSARRGISQHAAIDPATPLLISSSLRSHTRPASHQRTTSPAHSRQPTPRAAISPVPPFCAYLLPPPRSSVPPPPASSRGSQQGQLSFIFFLPDPHLAS